jgi:hypothetical protein
MMFDPATDTTEIGYVPAGELVVAVVEYVAVSTSPFTAPTIVPVNVGFAWPATFVAFAAVTTTGSNATDTGTATLVLVAEVVDPPYTAVNDPDPADSTTGSVAIPDPFSVVDPSTVYPLLNVTVPAAIPVDWVTTAVSVLLCPYVSVAEGAIVNPVVVGTRFDAETSVCAVDTLPKYTESPL